MGLENSTVSVPPPSSSTSGNTRTTWVGVRERALLHQNAPVAAFVSERATEIHSQRFVRKKRMETSSTAQDETHEPGGLPRAPRGASGRGQGGVGPVEPLRSRSGAGHHFFFAASGDGNGRRGRIKRDPERS